MRLHQFAAAACMALLAGASQAAFLVTYEAPGATHTEAHAKQVMAEMMAKLRGREEKSK